MDDYPMLNLFWTMLVFFLWIMWLFLLFKVITDIFRSHDLGGWGKAGWLILSLLLPFLGVLLYVIFRGDSMTKREIKDAQNREAAFKSYVREAASSPDPGAEGTGAPRSSHADDLAKLAELRDRGALTDEEFQRAKTKLLV
ncbi:SHOCT domain-containing protein [Streptomyces sp. NPDC058195]|uniref:SHOCT domain-containing protein n=1 Tax=Streptomyces sp. NPDC058195 TaxID=3346375 RepID=UPI0036EC90B2